MWKLRRKRERERERKKKKKEKEEKSKSSCKLRWKEWETWCIEQDRGQAERSRRVEHNTCFKTMGIVVLLQIRATVNRG